MKAKRKKRPNINKIRTRIREIAHEYEYDEQVLLSFAEYINGGVFKAVEPTIQELKAAVMEAFECSSYQDLKKDENFKLFVKGNNLKMNYKESWLKVYRKFVGLPKSERDAISETSINGVDVTRNFLPWKVFDLNPKTATPEDIKKSFNELAKLHHPDQGGNRIVFERLKAMRDSILAAY